MKKLTFKVSPQKDCSVVGLIKEVNKISCRIYFDLEDGFVAVENVNDTMIDTVIELVDKYYTILGVDIDNTIEEPVEEQLTSVVDESGETTTEDVESSTTSETVEEVAEKQPTVLEPQTEDDLIIKKVEFANQYLEDLINKLMRTAAWAMFKMNISEKEIGDFIYTSMSEISMRYNYKKCIEFSVGDIVDCNYGMHLTGEINGGHVAAIVCNISPSGMAYLVPITKMQTEITSESYLIFNPPEDVIYEKDYYKGGTALLDKAKYVRAERINEVIGRTTPDFFKKVLYGLASAFDFTSCLDTGKETTDEVVETPNATEETADEVVETPNATEETADEVVETPNATKDTTDKVVKTKATTKKVGGEEAALLEVIGVAFDKLDPSKKVEEQIESFLTDIGMTTTERMVTQSFVIACDINRINYENVILKLHEQFPKVKEAIIKNILKEAFKNWLEKYPTLVAKCPKISLMAVLKVFAKKFS